MGYRIVAGFDVTVADLSKSDKDDFAHRWCALAERPDRAETAAEGFHFRYSQQRPH